MNLCMLPFGNIVYLAIRFLDMVKFTTLTSLSLLISCKLSFSDVGLKVSSLPTLALKSNKIFVWYLGNLSNTCSVLRIIYPPHYQFYPLLGHGHSEQ
jgi:hypothetical protein